MRWCMIQTTLGTISSKPWCFSMLLNLQPCWPLGAAGFLNSHSCMLLAAAHNSQDVFMQADIDMYENNNKKNF